MTNTWTHIRIDRDERSVATVWFDVQGTPMNVFNSTVVAELESVVESLEQSPPKLVVFRSAKPSGFFAGADIKQLQTIASDEAARTTLEVGQRLFSRVEALPCPTIAVVHGPCLGGGLEFALSCKYRVAKIDRSTKLGLPEVQLGLIPGWGGTQRLPRLVGLRTALGMILEGSALSADKARKVGLVDATFPSATFDADVNRFVDEILAGKRPTKKSHGVVGSLLDGTKLGRSFVFGAAKKRIGSKAKHYPAIAAALHAIEAGFRGTKEAGYTNEREQFARVLFTDAARSLIDLFFQREKAKKLGTWVPGVEPAKIRRAVVVGGGTMGAGIAQLFASHGIHVVLKEVSPELAATGKGRIQSLTDKAAEKGAMSREQAATLMANINATHEWDQVAEADLAVEAVVEREDVKREVFRELARRLPEAVLATNTSALSVTKLGDATERPGRVAGLHFFNPVHRMQLVEVVRGQNTDESTLGTLVELVRKTGKVPVVVADGPGFLVNRILFPYMEEAVRLVTEGVPAVEIDKEAVRFGMPMGPLELMDQVGLDVAVDISRTLSPLVAETSPTPARLAAMVGRGWLGKKSGTGFYEYNGDKRGNPTTWPDTPTRPYFAESTSDLSVIQQRLIYLMVNEAAKCLEEGVVSDAWAVDLAMVLGTGFAPFRGGPLKFADRRGLDRVREELEALKTAYGDRFAPSARFESEVRSFYGETRSQTRVPEEVH